MPIKSLFWHILQKEIANRKKAIEHRKNMYLISKVKTDIVVVKVTSV